MPNLPIYLSQALDYFCISSPEALDDQQDEADGDIAEDGEGADARDGVRVTH